MVQVGTTCLPPEVAALPPSAVPVRDAGTEPDGGAFADAGATDAGARDASVDAGTSGALALPFFVDQHFVMSGKMGNGAVVAEPCASNPGDPQGGCLTITWTPGGAEWVGFYFQYPENNWGARPGQPITAGARRVRFTAWGEQGGESANFAAGIRAADGFQLESGFAPLTAEPRELSVSLESARYDDVTGAFAWFLDRPAGATVTIHLDDIRWE
jgi:hypothetical protein